ncbi:MULTISPECIES: hypothetical protein [Gallibacterium]|uniref:Hemophilus-specific protein n=2 Tax=Gallibacterium genomosp. 2 TaxID=155517 RepID=A0A0A2XIY1_9PAST|nr:MULTISPECIES: hypothetical protein [Gallibacterium]KGQ32311.1 hypothetical protein P375_05820 [Gallibacterium genomosp. 2]KGQ36720.1 hypothetical protein JP30_11645 [Gallibacterium anatis IPDH697-78]MDA3978093.1 hypothetical protein [Gallibacterium sp. AGMB14963]
MTKQKLLQGGKFLLMIAALLLLSFLLAALGMHFFPGTELRDFVQNNRAGLLIWRICLYGAGLFLILKISKTSEYWKQQMKRSLVQFLVLVSVIEFISFISH